MSDPQNVSTAMEAAAQAAGAGDFVSAERELRRAFALQEAALGSSHPDLANTLNNLGVVAERLNKPAEAERCYRRAYAIATGVLQPDHPFVVMSAKNLRDFCDARGIPFERTDAATPSASGATAQPRASWPPRKPDPSPAAHRRGSGANTFGAAPQSESSASSTRPRPDVVTACYGKTVVRRAAHDCHSRGGPGRDRHRRPVDDAIGAGFAKGPGDASAVGVVSAASACYGACAGATSGGAPPTPAPVEQPTPAPPPAATAPADSQPTEQKPTPAPKQTRPAAAAPGALATW